MKASNLDSGVLSKLIDAVVAQTIAEVGDVISIRWSGDLTSGQVTFRTVLNDRYSEATFIDCNRRLDFRDYGLYSLRYYRTISECKQSNDPEWNA